MTLLWCVVLVLTVVSSLNLLLVLALARRVRTGAAPPVAAAASLLPPLGHRVGAFHETGPRDTPVTELDLAEDTLVAFLSPACDPCVEAAETLLARRDDLPARTLAFVLGSDDDPRAVGFADRLGAVARPAFVAVGGTAAAAFGGVREYPTVLRVVGGEVVAASHEVDASVLRTSDASSGSHPARR
ncbi:MAG: hypothetical protein JWO76_1953 [Nocardioides sp.]|nr:hypothetical protein [Nocardioides sp.]